MPLPLIIIPSFLCYPVCMFLPYEVSPYLIQLPKDISDGQVNNFLLPAQFRIYFSFVNP
jgi:hypothetical protein